MRLAAQAPYRRGRVSSNVRQHMNPRCGVPEDLPAAARGQSELAIDSDPNASGFYEYCGARVVGAVAAPIVGNLERARPQLRLRTSAA